MKDLLLLAVLFFLSCVPLAWGEDEILELADFLFTHQDYEAAITECERFVFFHPDDRRVGEVHFRIAIAHRAMGNWEQSVRALRKAVQRTDKSALQDERRIELGITLIAGGQCDAAHLELLQVSQFSKDEDRRCLAFFFHGVAYLYACEWEKARESFVEFRRGSTIAAAWKEGQHVDELLRQAQVLPYRSAKVARILSTLVPGAGQAYAGAWKSGFNALALNSLLGFWWVRSTLAGDFLDAGLLFAFGSSRYYLGDRYRAGIAVAEYNDRLNREQVVRVLAVLPRDTGNRPFSWPTRACLPAPPNSRASTAMP